MNLQKLLIFQKDLFEIRSILNQSKESIVLYLKIINIINNVLYNSFQLLLSSFISFGPRRPRSAVRMRLFVYNFTI